jgi:hypothetical protein
MGRFGLWVVVALSVSSCTSKAEAGSGGSGISGGTGGSAQGSGVPSALAADWRWGSISTVDYYNPDTNTFTTPNGVGAALRLKADGTFVQAGYSQSGSQCTMRIFYWKSGTAVVNGTTLVLRPSKSVRRLENSCDAKNASEKRGWAEEETYTWATRPDPSGHPVLVLKPAEGEPTEYERRN